MRRDGAPEMGLDGETAAFGSSGEIGLQPIAQAPASATRISASALGAAVVMACVGLLMLGIQPMVLGGLQTANRLSVPQMGYAATVEMLALGAVSALLAARAAHRNLRLWGLVGCVALVVANGAGLAASGFGFVATRALAGAGGGVLIWLAVGLVTRRPDPARVNAIFLGAQALSQGALAALIPATVEPRFGANGSLLVLGGLAVLMAPLLFLVPDKLSEVRAETSEGPALQVSSLSGLAVAFLAMAGIVGLWVYVEPIAAAEHIAPKLVSLAIAASLGAQVVGAAIIVALDRWIRPAIGLIGVGLAFLAVTAVLAWVGSSSAFFAATLAFGLLWTFALALFLPLLIAADPSRRAAMFLPGAQLLGSSAGPLLAGAFATDTNINPALTVSAGLFLASMVMVLISARTRLAS